MNSTCAYKYCVAPPTKSLSPLLVSCPVCKMVNYCSQRCRDLDWYLATLP